MGPVAFQGELGAYSELAGREFFGPEISVSPSPTFQDVFDKVTNGTASAGIIPIENSLAGSVHENYDLLLEHRLHIIGEIKLRIVHHLIVNPGVELGDIRRVTSHPQALAQCRDFLRSLPGVEAIPVYDTAGAVRDLTRSRTRDTAAIASAQAAADYGLEILKSSIESNHENYTRFLVVTPESPQPEGELGGDEPARAATLAEDAAPQTTKVTVVFALHHEPGLLFKSLGVFALRGIDLLKIESRPLHGRPWEYLFYLDFAGSVTDQRCRKALDHLSELTTFLRVLGSYPDGRVVDGSSVLERPAPPESAQ